MNHNNNNHTSLEEHKNNVLTILKERLKTEEYMYTLEVFSMLKEKKVVDTLEELLYNSHSD